MSEDSIRLSKLIVDNDTALGGIVIKTQGYTSRDDYDLFTVWNANEIPASNYAGFIRHRGTLDNPQPIKNNDEIFSLFYAGWDAGNKPQFVAELTVGTEGEIKEGHIPGTFDFKLMGSNGLIFSALKIHSDGTIGLHKNTIIDNEQVSKEPYKFMRIKVDGVDYAVPLYTISNS